ncbi:MAG: CoA transferase [Gammaproteobacteria bacterium]|nr:CoA transferase [Gammaproteobacteria bacterium]
MSERPFTGLRVLEWGTGTACSYAGLLFSDRGADVIKVEPPEGDDLRWRDSHADQESKHFQWLARGKRSIVVDDETGVGRDVLKRLAASVDVVLTTWPGARLERAHVDYQTLRRVNATVVYVRNHKFGAAGEWADRPANDLVIQAFSGMLAGEAKRRADGTPDEIVSTEITQFPAGVMMAMGASAALYHRARSGVGQLVETSDLAAALAVQGGRVGQNAPDAETLEASRARLKALRASRAPYGEIAELFTLKMDAVASAGRIFYRAFSTRDGSVFMGALSKPLRDKIRNALGLDFLLRDDPSFDPDDPQFQQKCVEFERDAVAIMASKTTAEWLAILQADGVPCGEVTFPEDLGDSEQARVNEYVIEIDHPVDGRQLQVAPPTRFSAAPDPPYMPSPALGQHTDAILQELGIEPA